MAAHAAVEKLLLLGRSGKARDPFGVGHLGRDVPDLAQLQVDRDGEGEGDLHRARAVELVSGCPDLQRIRAGSELRRRKGETAAVVRSEEHTSELQSPCNLVCRLLLEKKKTQR